MRAVIQRVNGAEMLIEGYEKREISGGLVVFLGVMNGDGEAQADFLAKKVCELRIFKDENDKLNLSLMDIGGDMLIVSNFTLATDCKRGRRPNFDQSAPQEVAKKLYDRFIENVRNQGVEHVETGEFGEHMHVNVQNDGPVNIIIDTEKIGK